MQTVIYGGLQRESTPPLSMAGLMIIPCSPVNFKVRCFVGQEIVQHKSCKIVEKFNYNTRKECSEKTPSVKEPKLRPNVVELTERNLKFNDKVLGHGDKGTGFSGFKSNKGTYVENEGKCSSLAIVGDEARMSMMLISLSRANKVSSASSLYKRMADSGLQPTLHACNSLIACFLRRGFIDDALSAFESMKKMAIKPSEYTYSLVIKAVGHSQGWQYALHLLNEMETQDGLKLDTVAYNTLISVCGRADKWKEVHQLWGKLKQKGCKETMVTYRLLVSTFVQSDQVELALEAYHDMINNGWKPNEDVLKGLTCVCAKGGQWVLALDFFQNMVDLGTKPNKITYNTLINSLGKAREVDLAFKIYEHMQAVGHKADAYTIRALLNCLKRTGQFARSVSLFDSLKASRSFEMNTEIYNMALLSCQRLGLWEKALQYVWEMEKSGLKPGTLSYNILISTCEVARQPKVALQVYEHMLCVDCSPNTFTYLPLIRACGRGDLWCELQQVLKSLSHIGVSPNASIYNTLIQTLCCRGQIKLAKEFYLKMLRNGHRPDSRTSCQMLEYVPKHFVQNSKKSGGCIN